MFYVEYVCGWSVHMLSLGISEVELELVCVINPKPAGSQPCKPLISNIINYQVPMKNLFCKSVLVF